MERVHCSLALAALLVLAGCIGGGPPPSEAAETTGETTELAGTTDVTTGQAQQTTATGGLETTAGIENATLPEKDVFEAYGVTMNYSAGGDLDRSSVGRSETGGRSTVVVTHYERDGNRSLLRTNATGGETAIYHGETVSMMKTVRDGEASYLLLGNSTDDNVETNVTTDPASAFVVELAKLQLMPYEEVGTVTRNGTTMTKYEATGPGYYASDELAGESSVESYTSTVLIDEDGLVRLFHQEVVVERGGETVIEETTLRFEDVGTTTVTEPEWVENAYDETANTETEGDEDTDDE
ncbi:hypothetical protein BRD15_09790 [Halobacteriales archaeon SW_6_65_15]|nr:MAG: hypothetical protein BRD15_09790 [Halobacteriales archaeon SW_6_65_15]